MSTNVFQNVQLQRIADSISGSGGSQANFSLGVSVPYMEGATSSEDGLGGLVPTPSAGDEGKFLTGAGTWEEAGGGGGYDLVTRANGTATGITWDGLPIMVCCLNASGMSNGSATNFQFSTFGMSIVPQGVFRIELLHYVNGYWAECSGVFWDQSSQYFRGNLSSPLNGTGTLYIFFYYY